MPDVRTTIQPDRVLSVDERTAYDLRQQGLLVDDDAAPEQDPSTPGGHPDAVEHDKQVQDARREELGETAKAEDQAQANEQAQTDDTDHKARGRRGQAKSES